MTQQELTGRTYFIPLDEALGVLDEMLKDVEDRYRDADSKEARRVLAKQILALGMARQALGIAKLQEERRSRRTDVHR